MTEIKLGHRVRDTVSGLTGIVTCETTYLNGCVQLGVTPPVVDPGRNKPETAWLDKSQLVFVDEGIHAKPTAVPGGVQSETLPTGQ